MSALFGALGMHMQNDFEYGCSTIIIIPLKYTGRILNRFSKDIGFLDDLLPYIFCEYILVSTCVYTCSYFLCDINLLAVA